MNSLYTEMANTIFGRTKSVVRVQIFYAVQTDISKGKKEKLL